MFNHREQNDLVAHIGYINDAKNYLETADKRKNAMIRERELEIENVKNPLNEEIKICKFLIGYCKNEMRKAGLTKDSAQLAAELAEALRIEEVKKKVEEKKVDKKLEIGITKAERDANQSQGGSYGKKNKRGKKQQ